jgi:hypothetical protein
MDRSELKKVFLAAILAAASVAIGCGSNVEGQYRDEMGTTTVELKDGKASLNAAGIHLDGTYKVDGDQVVIAPTEGNTAQTVSLKISKDGSLQGPEGSQFPVMKKVK